MSKMRRPDAKRPASEPYRAGHLIITSREGIYSMRNEFAIGDLRDELARRITAREAAEEALRRAMKRANQCRAEEDSARQNLQRAEAQR